MQGGRRLGRAATFAVFAEPFPPTVWVFMFALEEIRAGIVHVLLPPASRLEARWWGPSSVVILTGRVPALINTGPPGSRDALLAALGECGVSAGAVRRVALTSVAPTSVGNLACFPSAVVYRGVGRDPFRPGDEQERALTPEMDRWRSALEALMHVDARPALWSQEDAERALASWAAGFSTPDATHASVVDEEPLFLGNEPWVPETLQGGLVETTAWFGQTSRVLAAGGQVAGGRMPFLRHAGHWLASLERLSSRQPERLIPGHAPVITHPRLGFRSAGLLVQGVLSNFLYLLSGPTLLLDIVRRDLGGWPDDLMVAWRALVRYDVLVRELLSDGVLVCQGDPLVEPLEGGSAQGPRTPSLLAMRRGRSAEEGR